MSRTVIITGGSNGIGKELVYHYANKGYKVVIADIDEKSGEEIVNQCKVNDLTVYFIKTDVSKIEDIKILIQKTLDHYGSLDILVNNAGLSKWQSPYEITVEEWDTMINTNLRSVMFTSREAAKVMKENANGGKIVNLASTRAFMSEPNSEAYAATKGGIISLTHALATSLSDDGIQVNSISPGWIETGDYSKLRGIDHSQHLSNRVGKPEDIAKACYYLTSPDNEFVTGINLTIDGGMTKKMIYEH
ncbi:NAD(P)-dependent dehydrogenase (short-subunit alcohol dehydrogenase family) [Metabacillus crassostreae]|uniref:SDR family oxidoreductase n=1 Tax=Metabacillus crassostreae TaxID=929098 RepID=UPI001959678E|nr:SDR family oxidoreductase [Metabacillus crassostreae]MBM7602146.1 NAD(P)-dependent dehydrogenase (short-subunit alcohol dehydrogenase family) [Metabacillus crassostreae]